VLAAGAAAAGLSVGLAAAGLPVSALARRRSLNAGMATQSWRDWGADVAKTGAISAVVSGAGGSLAVGLMRRYESRWWLPAAGGSVAFATVFSLGGPVVLEPLFNRFVPLADGDTRSDVFALARGAGVRVREVFEVDASRRTTAANAYVNGLGPTRRVVLFDTLLRTFTRDETRLVVAHELGHVRHRDVPRLLAFLTLTTPAAMNAAAGLTRALDGEPAQAGAHTLPALAVSLGAASALSSIFANALSRQIERRADSFALQLTDAPEAFVSFERRITLQNLADPAPPRWLTALLGTHPSTIERIGIARGYAATRA
jgi:STE24 endopeptidase